MIDVGRVVDEFGPRIYHVHAKDMEIDRDGLYDHGVMSLGVGWQRPRLPGMGEVDFPRFISALYRNGYDYVMCMEHEDRSFEGSVERVRSGFLLARDFLSPWMT
jgi:sugar phosphate isomerase/epimerase